MRACVRACVLVVTVLHRQESCVMRLCLLQAMATRDAMAKCLYGALFDWIVLQLNYSLLSKRDDREHKVGRASKATSQNSSHVANLRLF